MTVVIVGVNAKGRYQQHRTAHYSRCRRQVRLPGWHADCRRPPGSPPGYLPAERCGKRLPSTGRLASSLPCPPGPRASAQRYASGEDCLSSGEHHLHASVLCCNVSSRGCRDYSPRTRATGARTSLAARRDDGGRRLHRRLPLLWSRHGDTAVFRRIAALTLFEMAGTSCAMGERCCMAPTGRESHGCAYYLWLLSYRRWRSFCPGAQQGAGQHGGEIAPLPHSLLASIGIMGRKQ